LLRRSSDQPGLPGSETDPLSEDSQQPLFGLAPGGVCHAACRHRKRGALLPHPFTLACAPTSRKRRGPSAVCSLWHFPWASNGLKTALARRALPATLVSWSPDFPRRSCERRGCPAPRRCVP